MTRHSARVALASGVVLGSLILLGASVATLSSHAAPVTGEVGLTSLMSLPEGVAVRIDAPLLVGLDDKARRERGAVTSYSLFGVVHPYRANTLPLYLVRDGDHVRAFIAEDPRNGCDLEYLVAFTRPWGSFPTMLHDVCHGSSYDLHGNKLGGPTPWTLDQLVVTVHDGRVFARAGEVLPGRLVR